MYPEFAKFVRILRYLKPANMNVKGPFLIFGNHPVVIISRKGNKDTYLQLSPKIGKRYLVKFTEGHTSLNAREKGWGTRIRRLAANATLRAGMTVEQYAVNLEQQVENNTIPISGKIMHGLGATTVNGSRFLIKRTTRTSTRAHARNALRLKFPPKRNNRASPRANQRL
jgi:hypothetical protein